MSTNRTWWQADPDVYYMRKENSKLTEDESALLTGTIGLMGGVFLTSDFPLQWSGASKQLVNQFREKTSIAVPAKQFVLFSRDGSPRAFRVSYPTEGEGLQHAIGFL